jgi:hypothetical protein
LRAGRARTQHRAEHRRNRGRTCRRCP